MRLGEDLLQLLTTGVGPTLPQRASAGESADWSQAVVPTANVDIAPTVARILKFSMPDVQGRVLDESLQGEPGFAEYAVLNKTHRSSTRAGLTMKLPTDLDGRSNDPSLTTYAVELKTKVLSRGDESYTYFDYAQAIRK